MKTENSNTSKQPSDILLQLINPSFVTICMNKRSREMIKNFKLLKNHLYTNMKVQLPPETRNLYRQQAKMKQQVKTEYIHDIEHFYHTLTKKIHFADLTFFYRNIQSVFIEEKKVSKNYVQRITGQYHFKDNKIILFNNRYQHTLFHELFHLSSSLTVQDKCFSGFMQWQSQPVLSLIGKGLNEGYTSLLTERYFKMNTEKHQNHIVEKRFAAMIEQIIGQDEMEQLYFKADLYHLIEKLKKYAEEEVILDFLGNLDFINCYLYQLQSISEKQILEKLLVHMNNFLGRCYTNKLKQEFKQGLINKSNLNFSLYHFFTLLTKDSILIINNKELTIVDQNTLRQILLSPLNNDYKNSIK